MKPGEAEMPWWIDPAIMLALCLLLVILSVVRTMRQRKADLMTIKRKDDVVRFIRRS